MMELLMFLINLFQVNNNNIFVNQLNKVFSYKEIFGLSLKLAKQLNEMYPTPQRVILCADNSVQWIISFFGILFSKHSMYIVDYNVSEIQLRYIATTNFCTMIITDIDMKDSMYPWIVVLKIKTINTEFKDKTVEVPTRFIEQCGDINIIHYIDFTGKCRRISQTTIIDSIKLISNANLRAVNVMYEYPFSSDIILSIFTPVGNCSTILLQDSNSIFEREYTARAYDAHFISTTGTKFSEIWNYFIVNPNDKWLNFLRSLPKWIGYNKRIKKKLNLIYPELTHLHLKGELPFHIEDTLHDIKYPYSRDTYANVPLVSPTLYIFNRVPGLIDIINSLPFINSSAIGILEDKRVLIVSINELEAAYIDCSYEELYHSICEALEEIRDSIKAIPEIELRFDKLIILPSDFKRDHNGNILREYYFDTESVGELAS